MSLQELKYVTGLSALLLIPDKQVLEGVLPELFPPSLLKRGLGLEEDATPEQVLERFCGIVFLEILSEEKKGGERLSHCQHYERFVKSPEWKAEFGEKLPLRLCLATKAAGPGVFGLEGFPEEERELELGRLFSAAARVTVSEETELRWERAFQNHEAWLAGVAQEKGLTAVRAMLLQE